MEGGKASVGLGQVIDSSMQQLAKLGFLTCIIAWALTYTSRSLWLNLPLALVLILSAIWVYVHFSTEINAQKAKRSGLTIDKEGGVHSTSSANGVPQSPFESIFGRQSTKAGKNWREEVRSPIVEEAWETFCGSIIQEFIYDLWYNALTPDKEFPKEIRKVLNSAFGELAGRARKLDLKGVLLRDVSELLMDQIELYRHTRESIVQGLPNAEAWAAFSEEARDRALLAELKSEKNLHPALYTPTDSPAVLGQYKVLQTVCEGVVAFLLDRSDHSKPMMRSVARELLATCVFRPLLGILTPYYISKLLLLALRKHEAKKPLDLEEAAARAEAQATANADAAKGWEFAERARMSIKEEEGSSSRQSKAYPRKHPAGNNARSDKYGVRMGSQRQGSLKPSKSEANLRSSSLADAQELQNLNTNEPGKGSRPAQAGPRLEPAHRSAEPVVGSQHPTPLQNLPNSNSNNAPTSVQSNPSHSRNPSRDVGSFVATSPSILDWSSKTSFAGQPRARVVAAELNTEGSKDVVMYKIRVADNSSEWTVSRRFRNFESLHRTLKVIPTYRARLPAKRVFAHSQNVEFVEERRQQLDQYLQQILSDQTLIEKPEIWEFLSAWSEVYGIDCDDTILGSINASLKDANVNMRRAVGNIVDDVNAKRLQANANLARLANLGGSEAETGRPLPTNSSGSRNQTPTSASQARMRQAGGLSSGHLSSHSSAGRPERSAASERSLFNPDIASLVPSLPSLFSRARKNLNTAEEEFSSGAPAAELPDQAVQHTEEFRGHLLHYTKMPGSSTPEAIADHPTSSAHNDPRAQESSATDTSGSRRETVKGSGAAPLHTPEAIPNTTNGSTAPVSASNSNMELNEMSKDSATARGRERDTRADDRGLRSKGDLSASHPLLADASSSKPPSQAPSRQSSRPPSRANSVSRLEAQSSKEQLRRFPANALEHSDVNVLSTPKAQMASSAAHTPPDSGHIQVMGGAETSTEKVSQATAIDRMEAVPAAIVPTSLAQVPEAKDVGRAMLLEESAGISAPLYDVIDVLFELQSRGIFRRQVYGVARQMLSLVAGGAIDDYILSQLRALRQEHQLARLIHSLQITLWPGGIWFQRLPGRQPPPDAPPPPRYTMTAENFVVPPPSEPLDAAEIKEAVKALLMSSGPPALIRIIGRTAYTAGMQDLYDLIQSRTFLHQLGYGLLKIALVSLMPELRPLFRSIERAPLDSSLQS